MPRHAWGYGNFSGSAIFLFFAESVLLFGVLGYGCVLQLIHAFTLMLIELEMKVSLKTIV
jgi:hypothetical protein